MSDPESARECVSWRDRLPWLILLRVFRPAISARMLLCAAAGLMATLGGWRCIWYLFSGSADPLIARVRDAIGTWPAWPWQRAEFANFGHLGIVDSWAARLPGVIGPAVSDIAARTLQITLPFQLLFTNQRMGPAGLAFTLLCGVWVVAVWAFFGGVLTRTAALRLAREETISWQQAGNFTRHHWLSYFTAPLYPLAGILLTTIPLLFLGLLMRVGILALFSAIVLWPLALVGGLFMALLLLGLFFGWPLMWGTISVEGTDAFDGLSRSYAYVFQRPLQYLFYAIVAAVLGTLGWFVVDYFAEGVIWLTVWGASWGANNANMDILMHPELHPEVHSGLIHGAAALIAFWCGLVRLIAAGYVLSYFWTATTAIYLLLRRDVDAAELDEVYLDQADESFGLPPLTTDDQGVPAPAEEPVDKTAVPSEPAAGESLKDEE